MNKMIMTLIVAATVLMLAACNTMEGAGKDIQKGGEKLQQAAARK